MRIRLLGILVAGLCSLLGVTSCSAGSADKDNDNNVKSTDMKTDAKKLVVYFSHAGENYNVGYITIGNTHIIADMIAEAAGTDIFEIAPVTRYLIVKISCHNLLAGSYIIGL